jgi:hypothetical protein
MLFPVIVGKHLTFNEHVILVFETVVVNEGEHYDPYDGVFVAPHKGVYLFSWTVSGDNTNYIVTELVVEQNTISFELKQILCKCHVDSSVFMININSRNFHLLYHQPHN